MRPLTARDRAFLAKHKQLKAEDDRGSIRFDTAEAVDIAGEIKDEREKAIRWFDGSRSEWLPKSQISAITPTQVTIPMWLAKAKGFI